VGPSLWQPLLGGISPAWENLPRVCCLKPFSVAITEYNRLDLFSSQFWRLGSPRAWSIQQGRKAQGQAIKSQRESRRSRPAFPCTKPI
jgi:hypothetical protein